MFWQQTFMINPSRLQDGHVHIAALHAGGLAWPCPAWLQPRAPQTHSVSSSLHVTTQTQPRTDTAASSGVSDTSSGESDTEQQSYSSSNGNDSANPLAINGTAGIKAPATVAAAAADAVATAAVAAGKSNHRGIHSVTHTASISTGQHDISSCETVAGSTSQGDCTSPGSSESDSESDVEDVEDDIGPSAALGMRIQGFGVDQQAAFNQLDALFARRGAPGSMATQLAALDLLKRKQGHSMHSMHSRAQHSGGRSQKSPLCQLPGGAHGGESGGKAGSKQRLQAARNGGKAKPKTGWLQMQDGGNPLYSNQKSASASAGEVCRADMYI